MVQDGEVQHPDSHKVTISSPAKVTQAFIKVIDRHSLDSLPIQDSDPPTQPADNLYPTASESPKDRSQGHTLSKAAMKDVLDNLSEKTIGGCVKILEQLHLAESVLESE